MEHSVISIADSSYSKTAIALKLTIMSHHEHISCKICGKYWKRKYNKWGEHDNYTCDSCCSNLLAKSVKFELTNQPKRERCRFCKKYTGKRIARESSEEGVCAYCNTLQLKNTDMK